jgi:hypothetical protein
VSPHTDAAVEEAARDVAKTYASSTINLHLAAVRRLTYEAADKGLLSAELATGIRRLGVRTGNGLTAEQGKAMLDGPPTDSLRGKQDRSILALLLRMRPSSGRGGSTAAGGTAVRGGRVCGRGITAKVIWHVSIQTTERYLGCQQKLRQAVNDHLGVEPQQ